MLSYNLFHILYIRKHNRERSKETEHENKSYRLRLPHSVMEGEGEHNGLMERCKVTGRE